jgi:hypothetical protein
LSGAQIGKLGYSRRDVLKMGLGRLLGMLPPDEPNRVHCSEGVSWFVATAMPALDPREGAERYVDITPQLLLERMRARETDPAMWTDTQTARTAPAWSVLPA